MSNSRVEGREKLTMTTRQIFLKKKRLTRFLPVNLKKKLTDAYYWRLILLFVLLIVCRLCKFAFLFSFSFSLFVCLSVCLSVCLTVFVCSFPFLWTNVSETDEWVNEWILRLRYLNIIGSRVSEIDAKTSSDRCHCLMTAALWGTRITEDSSKSDIKIKTTLRELIIYIVFLVILLISKIESIRLSWNELYWPWTVPHKKLCRALGDRNHLLHLLFVTWQEQAYDTVAALAIDKAGPRPCHFRPGPTSGPATRPGSQKSKISTEKKFQYV